MNRLRELYDVLPDADKDAVFLAFADAIKWRSWDKTAGVCGTGSHAMDAVNKLMKTITDHSGIQFGEYK